MIEKKKYGNVIYIENEVSKEMEAEIEAVNKSANPKNPFPKFHFHLFKTKEGRDEMLYLNFVVESEDSHGLYARVYFQQYPLKTDQISLIEEKTKFLLRQYKLARNSQFLYFTHQQHMKYVKYENML